MYKIINMIDHTLWSEFVKSHPKGNIFQSPEMYKIFEATKNNEPLLIVAVNKDNRPVGVMLSVIQKELDGVLGRMTARAIIRGGPLVRNDDEKIIDLLISNYNEIIKKKAIYTQYRNFWEQREDLKVFQKQGFEYEEHLNILVDLNKTEKELWQEVHPKGKNKIRRAEKEGTKFKELINSEERDTSYNILQEVYSRAQLPLHDKSMFEAAYKILHTKGMIKYFGAIYEGKIIGTIVMLCYRDRIFDWYAGSYQKYYKNRPNDLLPWEVFLWGKRNGYKVFDFGGAGKPGVPYGVRDYKKKFGGEFVNFGRYEKVNKKTLMTVGKVGLKGFKLIKGIIKK